MKKVVDYELQMFVVGNMCYKMTSTSVKVYSHLTSAFPFF